jgi:hypothetical protein
MRLKFPTRLRHLPLAVIFSVCPRIILGVMVLSLDPDSLLAAVESGRRQVLETDDIVCANKDAPITGYPPGSKWSAAKFSTMWDLCSAYGNQEGNVGCVCESPGLSYDVDCYEDYANNQLYHDGGMFYLCSLRCRCKQHVPGRPLPEWMPLNRNGGRRGGGRKKSVTWEDTQGAHMNAVATIGPPTALPIPAGCRSLPPSQRSDCRASKKTLSSLSVSSGLVRGRLGRGSRRQAPAHGGCSARTCSSYSDCTSPVASVELVSVGLAPCRCQLNVDTGPSVGYFNLGSCFAFLDGPGNGKRAVLESEMDTGLCACNSSFVSASCCVAEKGLVWGQASLGQVLLEGD